MKVAFFILLAATIGVSCSVKPSSDPGLCSLSCSDAIITGNQYKIEGVYGDFNVECSGAFTSPQLAFFRVIEEVSIDGETVKRPVPNVSVQPLISGNFDATKTDSSLLDGNGDVVDYKYTGIVTPKDKWCSDSCGVVALEVWPNCPAVGYDNPVNIRVHSGSLFSDNITISISNPDTSASLRNYNKPIESYPF